MAYGCSPKPVADTGGTESEADARRRDNDDLPRHVPGLHATAAAT